MNAQKIELNDLFDYGYMIYQNKEYFKFSIDSVLLAEFVDIKKGQNKILDMCTGNAPVPLILSKKWNNLNITGVELQKGIYNLAIDSVKYNKVNNIEIINKDVKDLPDYYKNDKFDVITCNPPYFVNNTDKVLNDNKVKAIARHEIMLNLEDVIRVSSKILKNQGYFYMVHRAERLADIINLFNKYNFGLKKVIPVYNDKESRSCFILIEGIYNGKDYVIIEKPVFLSEYSSYKNIFGGR